ncbi:hypothetical protein BGZ49_003532 [Haplosporangium sp. Z 27]|nr:hypothetical protein BGZ49_003532 [Haplosporangium sp. Z 27]
MSSDVYAKISEKMKNEQFTEEEIKIVGKAKEQISSYTTGGSVIGGLSGIMLARARNFKGLQAAAIAAGGFFIGSQMGLIMGAMSSVKTIQSIPNFQRVLNIVQEVRSETTGHDPRGNIGHDSRGNIGQPHHDRTAVFPSAGTRRSPVQPNRSELLTDDAVQQQELQFEGFKDGDGYHGGANPNRQTKTDQNSSWAQAPQRAKELQEHSNSWGQIRQQNMPRSAWNDVRSGNHRPRANNGSMNEEDSDIGSDDSDSRGLKKNLGNRPKPTGWDRVRMADENGVLDSGSAPDGPSDFARTREDLESRPSRQKNQYGDLL